MAAAMKKQYYEGGGKPISNEMKVCTLMEFVGKKVMKANGKDVAHQIYKCPKESCTLAKGEISFQIGTGYTNPHNHLKNCLCGGNAAELEDYYWNAKAFQSKKVTISGKQTKLPFEAISGPAGSAGLLSQKDRDMYAYIQLIVEENCPISCVESSAYRGLAKDRKHFSIKHVRNVILAMTLSIEETLKDEMAKASKISIVHDAWSKFGEHYFALMATYIATRTTINENGVATEHTGPVISLLSVAPLHTPTKGLMHNDGYLPLLPEDVETEMEQACEFTAQVHADHITHILLHYYDIIVGKKVTNQTCDSASVNLALAKLLGIPHVNCECHLLNNELKLWITNTTADGDEINPNGRTFGAGDVLKATHKLMVSLKTNKNRAVLQRCTDLTPKIGCETRWSSSHAVMDCLEGLRPHLTDVEVDEHSSNVIMPPIHNSYFNRAAAKTTAILNDINHVSVMMQKRLANVAYCGDLQDVLIKASESQNAHWSGNTFGKTYIAPDSTKRPNVDFLNAVKKCQKREASTLTPAEKDTIKKWLPKESTTVNNSAATSLSVADQIAKLSGGENGKRKCDQISLGNGSDDCMDHVIGCAAEVERLWSIGRYILTTTRTRMHPILFEAILFLRANRALWDENTVKIAMDRVRADQKSERLAKKLKDADEEEAAAAAAGVGAAGEEDNEDANGGGDN